MRGSAECREVMQAEDERSQGEESCEPRAGARWEVAVRGPPGRAARAARRLAARSSTLNSAKLLTRLFRAVLGADAGQRLLSR